jgi:hypothetical protein
LKAFLAILFALCVAGCTKSEVVEVNGMKLTLTSAKCTDTKILSLYTQVGLLDIYADKIFAGSVVTGSGEKRTFCYIRQVDKPNVLFVIDQEGDGGVLDIGPKKPSI